MVHVDAEVAAETGEVSVPVRLLVDSGAVYSVLPYDVWRSLGLRPSRTMEFVLADGTVVRRDVSHAMFTYHGIGRRVPSCSAGRATRRCSVPSPSRAWASS
jgi:predicted aspartyl protease